MDFRYIVQFSDVGSDDVVLVGGKGANLGEMTRAGFPVPPGFIITSKAYFDFVIENNLQIEIAHLLGTINFQDQNSLDHASAKIKKYITEGHLSQGLIDEISQSYSFLSGLVKDIPVAVRSSATAEDLPNASFAGQQETFLNVQSKVTLLLRIKDVWASLFDSRAIFYRHEHVYDDLTVGVAIPVQKMVDSEASGIMFTIDPVTNDKSKIIIEAIFGLGELIVQGVVTPDHYKVNKSTLSITKKTLSQQTKMLIKKGMGNKEISLEFRKGKSQKISDNKIIELAKIGEKLEKYYHYPQDIEWAIEKDTIYLVQTRPVTTIAI